MYIVQLFQFKSNTAKCLSACKGPLAYFVSTLGRYIVLICIEMTNRKITANFIWKLEHCLALGQGAFSEEGNKRAINGSI